MVGRTVGNEVGNEVESEEGSEEEKMVGSEEESAEGNKDCNKCNQWHDRWDTPCPPRQLEI